MIRTEHMCTSAHSILFMSLFSVRGTSKSPVQGLSLCHVSAGDSGSHREGETLVLRSFDVRLICDVLLATLLKPRQMKLKFVGSDVHDACCFWEVTLCSLVGFYQYFRVMDLYLGGINFEPQTGHRLSFYTNAWMMPRLVCDRFVSNLFQFIIHHSTLYNTVT
jgi:hypothetical protein